jgi:hypothetical protein
MKITNRFLLIVACFFLVHLCVGQAPADAPAGATGLCNDGTYYKGATKQGACKGHKGVKDWYATALAAVAPATTSTKAAAAPASTAPAMASGPAPSNATGLCNDGTYYTGATKQGACRGHKGVKDWYAATPPAAASTQAAVQPATAVPPTPAPAPSAKASTPKSTVPPTDQTAPGGGAGQVWLNTSSNVYHCEGSRYYGKTKEGAYMTESAAKAKGARADHGKVCTAP